MARSMSVLDSKAFSRLLGFGNIARREYGAIAAGKMEISESHLRLSVSLRNKKAEEVAMARSMSVLDSKAFSRLLGFGNIARREYGAIAAGKMEMRGVQAEAKEAEEKKRRQRSWMPHPITGYYLPEDHFGDIYDVPQVRESKMKYNTLPSRPQN